MLLIVWSKPAASCFPGARFARPVALLLVALISLVLLLAGCGSLPSRKAPRLSPAPKGVPLDPPPPRSVLWLRFASAQLHPETPGGQAWDEGGGLPDAYAVLLVDGEEAFRTDSVEDSLAPVWADSPGGNFEFTPESKLVVQLMDDDGLNDQPIGKISLAPPSPDQTRDGVVTLDLGRSITLKLAVEPAHALVGLGFSYNFANRVCQITSRFDHGPAGRAGMKVGDQILTIDGREVASMSAADLRGVLLSVPMKGLSMNVLHKDNRSTELVTLVEGPIYPLYREHGAMD